jgi:hypothetical protein
MGAPSLPDTPPGRRRVEIRSIDLPPGDTFEIDFHPNDGPTRITVDGGASLCPGRLEWPSWTNFHECRVVGDGTPVALPSTGGGFHVGVELTGLLRTEAVIRRVVLDYVAADRFFEITTGSFAPEELRVRFTPSFPTVGAGLVDPVPSGASLQLEQDGHTLRFDDAVVRRGEVQSAHSTSAARPGRPITVSLHGGGKKTVSMLLEWN